MKKAFTLVEILVSIVLLVIISLFVSSTIQQTKSNNNIFIKKLKSKQKVEFLSSVLYDDIFQATEISVKSSKKFSVLYLRSKNSIYDISEPYIVWLVLKKRKSLVRFESAIKIKLPITEKIKNRIFADLVSFDCKNFTISISKNRQNLLVFINIDKNRPVIFEIKRFSK